MQRIGCEAIKEQAIAQGIVKPRERRPKKEPLWRESERLSFSTGLRHAVYFNSGDVYVGEWGNGLKEGKGHLNGVKGWRYEGDWLKGLRHGHGVLGKKKENHCDKNHYVGDWKFGKRDGYGRQIYENGDVYIGNWSEGKCSGHGRMWYKNGDFYEGDWINNKPHGYGIFVHVNGCRYEGEWMNGLRHGYGRFYHLLTGQLQDGLWIEGVGKCSDFTDILYRQSAKRPTQYPLRKLELENSDDVKRTAEEYAINKLITTQNEGIMPEN
ncbi:MORN repeat-containing protein 3-like [Ischnura elegans]|uniref:MORN repeat-containing protein 3-like n=1 Tax=Ischnura elegans TaxID=197161 RepID=UPI001ED88731|nr:MORN repeat-containing protein 3-like [Ischnura elegans]